ncbi:hypothetical protein [Bdellovibrio bacteriovorus]|nr:hypothetical protein [Bdellovibrio bacteriovorus]
MNAKPKKNRPLVKKQGDEKTNGMTTPTTLVLGSPGTRHVQLVDTQIIAP